MINKDDIEENKIRSNSSKVLYLLLGLFLLFSFCGIAAVALGDENPIIEEIKNEIKTESGNLYTGLLWENYDDETAEINETDQLSDTQNPQEEPVSGIVQPAVEPVPEPPPSNNTTVYTEEPSTPREDPDDDDDPQFWPPLVLECWEFGDPADFSTKNYVIYDVPFSYGPPTTILTRWDDYCIDSYSVMKVSCPSDSHIVSSQRRNGCPGDMRCLNGRCLSQEDYDSAEKCMNISGTDGTVELCEGYTFTHEFGPAFTPEMIYSEGALQGVVVHVTGASVTELNDEPVLQEFESDSGEMMYFFPIQYDSERMVFQLSSETGIDPSEVS